MHHPLNECIYVGLDVGSTTAKAVVTDCEGTILWQTYARHNSHQKELVAKYLEEIESRFGKEKLIVFSTGSGGRKIGEIIGGTYVQEVNAVTVAVEARHPKAGAVVELGGQDAKVILWKTDPNGRKTASSFMNDKCAGGTGATLDKTVARLHLSAEDIAGIDTDTTTEHHVAAKCGVFAETDVVGLLKSGVAETEILVSLCAAIVKQNMEVLLHGNPLRDDVILLGGPHTYYKPLLDIWRREVPKLWKLHHHSPAERPIEKLVAVPEDSLYYAALGAVLFGIKSYLKGDEHGAVVTYKGAVELKNDMLRTDHTSSMTNEAVLPGLVGSDAEKNAFVAKFKTHPIQEIAPGSKVTGYLGIDGGSTSSKLAIVDADGEPIYTDYILSKGNPVHDVQRMLQKVHQWQTSRNIDLTVGATGVTGYASDILQKAFDLDVAVVETVAHLKSAMKYYGDIDIICDVGGQDIKVMFMKHGRVVDIKLNTQCSAGNGYFLQSMAQQFGIAVEDFATHAFTARKAPSFNYGCAVFMEQDKVNFQQLGWTKEEIMAGLALVLPKNIWNYVVQETNLSRLGTRFLLQGGTQRNMAAVKAQIDYIEQQVPDAEVHVHRYAPIAGAIGAAIESIEKQNEATQFKGFAMARKVAFSSQNDNSTRCRFCANRCTRNIITITTADGRGVEHITGYHCDKGQYKTRDELKAAQSQTASEQAKTPNLVELSEERVFGEYACEPVPPELTDDKTRAFRKKMVVGIPRLLNNFYYAPFFSNYLKSLGVGDVVFSDPTSKKLWEDGNKWGSIDPCFPAKVAPAHVYNLLKKKEVSHIVFPMITHLETCLNNTLENNACVIQMGTPEVVEAAFLKNRDHFNDNNKKFWKPLVRMDRKQQAVGGLFEFFESRMRISKEENAFAAEQGFIAMQSYLTEMQSAGAGVINHLVSENRIGVVLIGHPYHHDSGMNHGIPTEIQKLGFPVLCIEALPQTPSFLTPLFGKNTKEAFDITDVWQRNFNRNTNHKIWAAKVAARHPNLVVVDLSSFKCGHDAPTYSYIDRILDASGTPHYMFHDLDQNKPSQSIKIRIQSIEYFLNDEQEKLAQRIRSEAG